MREEDIQEVLELDYQIGQLLRSALRRDGTVRKADIEKMADSANKDVRRIRYSAEERLADQPVQFNRKLSWQEIQAFWLIYDRARLTLTGRMALEQFFRTDVGEFLYHPLERESSALLQGGAPGAQFAGPGFRADFMERPFSCFELAAKFHDTAYAMNGIPFTGGSRRARSRRAKADYVFRRMTEHSFKHPAAKPINRRTAGVYDEVAKGVFDGASTREFLRGDGYRNPLERRVVGEMSRKYLMIPADRLASATRSRIEHHVPSGQCYYVRTTEDGSRDAPCFPRWFEDFYGETLVELRAIDGDTGSANPIAKNQPRNPMRPRTQ
jgi:hypothetical protein